MTIKDAITAVESARASTLVTYISPGNALIGPEDAPVLANVIEQVLPPNGKIPRLDLFLHSPGGFLDSAYKIVTICREYSDEFNVIVPFYAKSAATVICLGANEIIMTSISELGPIDPIIQHPYRPEVRVPARSIKDFFKFLNSTETGDKIVVEKGIKDQMASLLDPYLIGSYQTALESSKQIAGMLLHETHLKNSPDKVPDVVEKLTDFYFSHNFPIDRAKAKTFGLNVKNAEDSKELIVGIKTLSHIYNQFMQANNVVKLIGNRDMNTNFFAQPLPGQLQQTVQKQ